MLSTGIIAGLIYMLCVGIGDFLQSISAKRIGTNKTVFVRYLITFIIIAPLSIYQ